jgi:hypothetical protein
MIHLHNVRSKYLAIRDSVLEYSVQYLDSGNTRSHLPRMVEQAELVKCPMKTWPPWEVRVSFPAVPVHCGRRLLRLTASSPCILEDI